MAAAQPHRAAIYPRVSGRYARLHISEGEGGQVRKDGRWLSSAASRVRGHLGQLLGCLSRCRRRGVVTRAGPVGMMNHATR